MRNTAAKLSICLFVIEKAMRHFYTRAETGKAVGRSPEQVDEDYRQAAAIANIALPYRHSRLSAVKLAGDPNSPILFNDNATADELRAEIMKRIEILVSAGLIDLKALPGMVELGNQPVSGVQSGINGE
jgi:hypothetical protein